GAVARPIGRRGRGDVCLPDRDGIDRRIGEPSGARPRARHLALASVAARGAAGMSGRQILRQAGLTLGLPVALLAAWWIASAGSANFYFPPLQTIAQTFVEVWVSPRIFDDVIPSLARLAAGYLAAVALGLAIGIPIGLSRTLRNVLEPVLEFLRAIPPPALVPILILFAGIGDTMKMLVIVSGCIWPVLLNTVEAVRGRDEVLADVVRSYRIGA